MYQGPFNEDHKSEIFRFICIYLSNLVTSRTIFESQTPESLTQSGRNALIGPPPPICGITTGSKILYLKHNFTDEKFGGFCTFNGQEGTVDRAGHRARVGSGMWESSHRSDLYPGHSCEGEPH